MSGGEDRGRHGVGDPAPKDPGPRPPGEPLDETAVRRTLTAVPDRAVPSDVEYRFAGTASSVLRGIQLPAGDVDILPRERRGVDLFAAVVAQLPAATCLFAPALLPEARQYFARYDVGGVVTPKVVPRATPEVALVAPRGCH